MSDSFIDLPATSLSDQLVDETSRGKTAVNVIPLNSGSIIEGISYDYLYIDRPDNVTEIYTYRLGGATGEIQAVVRATYTSGSAKYLQSIERLDI